MQATPLLSASILGADWLEFGKAVRQAEEAGADLVQLDVADGIFTPTITFGEELVRRVRHVTELPVEVHLMVSRPQDWVSVMVDAGADLLTFHIEAVQRLQGIIEQIRRSGMSVGIALNPETRPESLEYVLPYIDLVNLLAVVPGFAGQRFIPETIGKIKRLRSMIDDRPECSVLIEVDGGIKAGSLRAVLDAGADVIVVSSGIFHSGDPVAAGVALKDIHRTCACEGRRAELLKNFGRRITARRVERQARGESIQGSP